MKTLDASFILSDAGPTITSMHHPWRELRDNWPDWDVRFAPLPDGIQGCTVLAQRTIWISIGLGQAERRSCLAHELGHVAAGHDDADAWDEAQVEQTAARLLLPLEELVDVLPWAHNLREAAEELCVDVDMLWSRLDHLHPAERAAIKRAFAARDNEESP